MEPTQTPQVPGTKPEPIPFEPVKPVLVMPKEVSAPIPVVAPEPVIPPQPIVPPPPAPAKKIVMPFVPPPPPPQKPSTSHKGIWITLLVFLLLLAACGAYVYYTLFLPAKVTPLTQQDAVTHNSDYYKIVER